MLRFHRRREERYRRLRPDACEVANPNRSDPLAGRLPSFSVCRGRRQRNFFRNTWTPDQLMHTLVRHRRVSGQSSSLAGHYRLEQRRDHAQRRCTLHRHWPRRDARLQRVDTAPDKVAAPEPNRVLPHAKRFRAPRAAPARQRQQHGTRPIRLPAIVSDPASAIKATCCSALAATRDFPPIPHLSKSVPPLNQTKLLVNLTGPA